MLKRRWISERADGTTEQARLNCRWFLVAVTNTVTYGDINARQSVTQTSAKRELVSRCSTDITKDSALLNSSVGNASWCCIQQNVSENDSSSISQLYIYKFVLPVDKARCQPEGCSRIRNMNNVALFVKAPVRRHQWIKRKLRKQILHNIHCGEKWTREAKLSSF